MDNLAIQRSLIILEERYRELREMGERRFQALEAERAAAAKIAEELKLQLAAQVDATQQAQQASDEYANRLTALKVQLARFKDERAAAVAGVQRLRHLAHHTTVARP